MKLGFLCSHQGRNMQQVVTACRHGELAAEPAVVISNNSDSGALAFARAVGIPSYRISTVTHPGHVDEAICQALQENDVDLVLLIGYNKLLGRKTLAAFSGRILNTHPAPLPGFGGKGMYGMRVHESVLAPGLHKSAVSIHLVDEEYDHGPVVSARELDVLPGDNPESLAARVREVEGEFLVETLQKLSRGEILLRDLEVLPPKKSEH